MENPKKISLRNKIALKLFDAYRHNAAKEHKLTYLFWECTLRCTLNCLHCGSDCRQISSVKDMPIDDFINAVKQIIPIVDPHKTMIVFTGGEALVRKDIEQAGIQLYHLGFPWGIVSNGYLLTKERLTSLLNAGMRACTISLDGLKESHNWLRQNEQSFDRCGDLRKQQKLRRVTTNQATAHRLWNKRMENLYHLPSRKSSQQPRFTTIRREIQSCFRLHCGD